MRLPLLPPEVLTADQRTFYDRARNQIERGFTAFRTTNEDGALLGPWSVFIHEPAVGAAHYDMIDAVTALKRLPDGVKQVAILATGARYQAAYELYAHAALASSAGLSKEKVATLAARGRPVDLTHDETIAYDVTTALLDGGVLPGPLYAVALERFGQPALTELVLWIGIYAQVAITLNAFDVPSEDGSGRDGAAR